MSYVAAKLCHFERLATRARQSEATAAYSSGNPRTRLKCVESNADGREPVPTDTNRFFKNLRLKAPRFSSSVTTFSEEL
jgi:hypothetical protein